MTIDFYLAPASSSCRAVSLTVAALGISDKIQEHKIDFDKDDHLKPEFVKLNPQHAVPTIVDDGFPLWESRAIIRYLVNKYGGDDSLLYPADPKIRGVIDQRLDFDLGTLYLKFENHFYPLFYDTPTEEGSLEKLQEVLGYLNKFLEGQQYAAGDNLTIADLSLVATVSTIEVAGVDLSEYPNIHRWYELVKSTAPNYVKANAEPLDEIKAMIENKLKSN